MISQYKHTLIVSKTNENFNLLVSFGNWIKSTILLIKSWLFFLLVTVLQKYNDLTSFWIFFLTFSPPGNPLPLVIHLPASAQA